MLRFETKARIAATLVVVLLGTFSLVPAETTYAPQKQEEEVPALAMLADLVVLRPFGIAAMVMGTAAFIAALPFSLPTKSVEKVAQKLIVEPAKYTFARPLGQIPGASVP